MRRRSPAILLNYVPQCSCALRASCIASSYASHALCLMSSRALHCFKNWSFPLRISSVNVIWSHLLRKSLMENFFFCAVLCVLCPSCSLPSPASCPTCSRALRASVPDLPRVIRVPVLDVLRSLHVLKLCVLSCITCFMLYMLFHALYVLLPHVSYVLLCLTCLVPCVFSCCSYLASHVLFCSPYFRCFKSNTLPCTSCLVAFMACAFSAWAIWVFYSLG